MSIYFGYISKYWWPYNAFCVSGLVMITILLVFIPESPCFLYEKGRYEKARKSLTTVARYNGVVLSPFKFDVEGASPTSSMVNQEKAKGSLKQLVGNKTLLKNLIILSIQMVCCSFNFYMFGFLMKYIKGSVYINTISGAIADIIATIASGFLYTKFGIKKALFYSWIVATIGGVLMSTLTPFVPSSFCAVLVMFSRLGMSSAYNLVFLANVDLFPAIYGSTVMGITNFFAKAFTILSNIVSETPKPIPMVVFTALSVLSAVTVLMLKKKDEIKTHDKLEQKVDDIE